MNGNKEWDSFRNTQRKIAYHPKCQRCSRNCKQKLAGQDADLPPVSQSQVNHYLFSFRGREPPQGLDTEFCPCGGRDFTPFRE